MGSIRENESTASAPPEPDEATRNFRRAGVLTTQDRWEEAVQLYEAVAHDAPDHPGIFQALGDAQARLQQWVPAAHSYVRALVQEPDNAILYRKLGDLQLACGDAAGAVETHRRAEELRRTAPDRTIPARLPLPDGPEAATAYLELMKGCLTFLLWGASDGPILELSARRPMVSFARILERIARRRQKAPIAERAQGRDWPAQALTMIGKERLDHIQTCVERVLEERIPGDLIEAGVWRGGGVIFMRAILRAYGDRKRKVWVADSFAGLPRPDIEKYPADRGYDLSVWHALAVSAETVRENFRRFLLLDEQVAFLEGWFADTLPRAPIERLAVMRLDGDLYESTMDALVHLYPKLSPGGFAIVDDYFNSPPCRQAVEDYRQRHAIRCEMAQVDWSAAFWRKT